MKSAKKLAKSYFVHIKLLLATLLIGSLLFGCGAVLPEPDTGASTQPSTSADDKAIRPARAEQESDQGQQSRHRNDKPAVEEVVVTAQHKRLQMADVARGALASSIARHPPGVPYPLMMENRENYQSFKDNGVQWALKNPVSTFSIDVDTAAYANVRRMLNQGLLPPADAVRVEEMLNYFNYSYPAADNADTPFSLYTEMGPSPWDAHKRLLHVGVKGWQPQQHEELPPANLVFLIDVSGSMQAPGKIQLLKRAMKMLARQLRAQDRIGIAVYAGASGEALAPTAGSDQAKILTAIDSLQAGGSTNGEAGIRLAYSMARQNFVKDGINRVILATDGDFNVGVTDIDQLQELVVRQRESGVALTVLGFGAGNYNDHLMQKLAQNGNGNAAYIDSMHEARKVLVDEMGATLNTIAKDMKVQIEFNPAVVETYRLIGYETRHLNREDFNNDRVDAGEVGAGHTVTALYELSLVGDEQPVADPLRYRQPAQGEQESQRGVDTDSELGFLKVRYKLPKQSHSRLITQPLLSADIRKQLPRTSENYRFSAAVAWLGQLLRQNEQVGSTDYQQLIALASNARGADLNGYRSEFVKLARTAEQLAGQPATAAVTH